MKRTADGKRANKQRLAPVRSQSRTHLGGAPGERVALPEVEVFTDDPDSTEFEVATRDLRNVHDAQVADDDFK